MKVVLLAGLIGVAIGAATGIGPETAWGFYRELYPSDPAHRRALDACFAQDPGFNRSDPSARAACYAHNALLLNGSVDLRARRATAAASNFVDLWRSAGQGSLPQNDVRAEQRMQRYPGALAAVPAR